LSHYALERHQVEGVSMTDRDIASQLPNQYSANEWIRRESPSNTHVWQGAIVALRHKHWSPWISDLPPATLIHPTTHSNGPVTPNRDGDCTRNDGPRKTHAHRGRFKIPREVLVRYSTILRLLRDGANIHRLLETNDNRRERPGIKGRYGRRHAACSV
jgi:hypothetical protein